MACRCCVFRCIVGNSLPDPTELPGLRPEPLKCAGGPDRESSAHSVRPSRRRALMGEEVVGE